MHVVGVIEVAVGAAILGAAPVLGAYVARARLQELKKPAEVRLSVAA